MAFGKTGPYEVLVGVARFAVDPAHLRNRAVVDLPLAPRNKDGKVEFEADVFILAPTDPALPTSFPRNGVGPGLSLFSRFPEDEPPPLVRR